MTLHLGFSFPRIQNSSQTVSIPSINWKKDWALQNLKRHHNQYLRWLWIFLCFLNLVIPFLLVGKLMELVILMDIERLQGIIYQQLAVYALGKGIYNFSLLTDEETKSWHFSIASPDSLHLEIIGQDFHSRNRTPKSCVLKVTLFDLKVAERGGGLKWQSVTFPPRVFFVIVVLLPLNFFLCLMQCF